MNSKSENRRVSRRQFIQDSALAAAGLTAGLNIASCQNTKPTKTASIVKPVEKTRSFNSDMEYRILGKTGLSISAVALGGHWKKVPYRFGTEEFKKNRYDVVSACIDCGINHIDACSEDEVLAYAEALRGRRDKMHLGFSFYEHEMRNEKWQTKKKLLEGFDDLMTRAKLDYVDLWRITCYWKPSTNHSIAHEEAIVGALEHAQKAGKARFTGISTHKHDWVIRMMNTYHDQIQVVVVPYTAGSKNVHSRVDPGGDAGWQSVSGQDAEYDESMVSVIDEVKKNNCGWFGIKPFASGSVFKSRGRADSKTKEEDDRIARITLRYILANDALTAPIPGMITIDQVKNAARAVSESRQLDSKEVRELDETVKHMWANLPKNYQWLKHQWEWV
ncbi:MAG: aldo/keto reductase [Planctomycetota bacterium]